MSELRSDNALSPASGSGALATSYLRILREQWLVVVLCFLLCVAGGVIGRNLIPTSYSAQADLLISPIDISDETYVGVGVFRSISSDPTANVLTLSRYLKTPATARVVKQRLHLAGTPDDLLNDISVQPLSQTSIVSVRASAANPQLARNLADAFVDATLTRRTQQVQSDVKSVIARLQQQIKAGNPKATASLAPLQSRLATLRSLVGLRPESRAGPDHARQARDEPRRDRDRAGRAAARVRRRAVQRQRRWQAPPRGRAARPRPASRARPRAAHVGGDAQ
jgi:capsular polysaccharide biosynthesis protein